MRTRSASRLAIGAQALRLAVAAGALAMAAVGSARADEVEYRSLATGGRVDAVALARPVLAGGVVARLPAGQTATALMARVTAVEPAAVYLGASTGFVFAACLSGAIDGGTGRAGPGEVIVWDFAGSKPQRRSFDAARFLATSPLAADPALRASLDQAAAGQQQRLFWGLLEPVGINLQAPDLPPVEAAMREHLANPTVARLRQEAAAAPVTLPRRVAERFIAALAARDREAVAALLHPDLFRRPEQAAGDWPVLRARFADQLIAGPLPARLAGAEVAPGADAAHWRVRAQGRSFALTLATLDSVPFVTALDAEPNLAALELQQ